MIKTPELDKMLKVHLDSRTIGGFLEWLSEQSIVLAEFDTIICEGCCDKQEGLICTRSSNTQLLANYFGIDLVKAETERQVLLDDIRAKNEGSEVSDE